MNKAIYFLFFSLVFIFSTPSAYAESLSDRLAGKILLQVQDKGQAYYVDPGTQQRVYLGRPSDAFRIMRELGLGIKHDELLQYLDTQFPSRLSGKIMLDVENNGEAYYVYPDDLQGYYLGRPTDAFQIMREKGLGITNEDLEEVPVFQKYKEQVEELKKEVEKINADGEVLGEQVKKQEETITEQQKQIEDLQKKVGELSQQPPSNNSGDTSSNQGNTQTTPTITFSRLESVESPSALNPGDTDIVLLGFTITPNTTAKINSIKVLHSGTGAVTDLQNIGLFEQDTGAPLAYADSSLQFNNINKILSQAESFIIKADVVADPVGNKTHQFSIPSDAYVTIEPLIGIKGIPINGREFLVHKDIGLTITPSGSSGSVLSGGTNVIVASFYVTAAGDDIRLERLSVVVDRSSITNGGAAEALQSARIYFKGAQVGTTKTINEGSTSTPWDEGTKFAFGSTAIIPQGKTEKIEVRVYAVPVAGGTPFVDYETMQIILLAGTDNVRGKYSVYRRGTNAAVGSVLTVRLPATVSVEKSLGWAGCESAESCSDRNAGDSDVKIGSFVIRAKSTIESLELNQILFAPISQAEDYSALYVRKTDGTTICDRAPSTSGTIYCTLYSRLGLSEQQVFDVYADISTSPSYVGGQPYNGFAVQEIRALGTQTAAETIYNTSVPLQKLYVAP